MNLAAVVPKVCSQCGKEKPSGKFYRDHREHDGYMRHCKACHNGTTALNARERAVITERQWGDPSEEQIAAATAAIRQRWNQKTRKRRRSMAWVFRKAARMV